MKNEEDEAFDEIERRQGGGFKAKQAMAMDKVSPFEKWWYYEGSGPPQKGEDYEEHTKRMCEIAWSNGADVAAQPAQEPAGMLHIERLEKWLDASLKERKQREWVGLTDEQRLTALKFIDPQTARLPPGFKQFAESIEQLLKEKNA